jgi:hypothetical protein
VNPRLHNIAPEFVPSRLRIVRSSAHGTRRAEHPTGVVCWLCSGHRRTVVRRHVRQVRVQIVARYAAKGWIGKLGRWHRNRWISVWAATPLATRVSQATLRELKCNAAAGIHSLLTTRFTMRQRGHCGKPLAQPVRCTSGRYSSGARCAPPRKRRIKSDPCRGPLRSAAEAEDQIGPLQGIPVLGLDARVASDD